MSQEEDPSGGDEWENYAPEEQKIVITTEPYEVREVHQVQKIIEDNATEISEIFGITKDDAICVLKYFKWNTNQAKSKWFENEKKHGMQAGVTFDRDLLKAEERTELLDSVSVPATSCLICFQDFTPEHPGEALRCGHRFCESCWKGAIEAAMSKGKDCINSTCPFAGCFMQISQSFFKKYCSAAQFVKYSQFLARSFTDENKQIRWCPAAGCQYFVSLLYGLPEYVKCKCGTMFCFSCGNEPHTPVTCDMLAKWLKKNASEGENYLWLLANTKPCPKCKADIEKNGGCFYMKCYKCQHEFCWSCLRPWSEHSDHWTCNLFDKEVKSNQAFKDRIEAQKVAESEIKKFGFYYEKYHSHNQGLDYATREYKSIDEKMEIYRGLTGLLPSDMDFLKEAVLSIIEMRRVLKHSYVLGYYMGEAKGKDLYQFQQGCLEQFCDKLHQLIEKQPDDIMGEEVSNSAFFRYKSDVANYYTVCRKVRPGITS